MNGSRRAAAEWARPVSRVTPVVDVLIPTADAVLYLDDDVWLEPGALGILLEAPTTIPRRDLDAFDPALIGSSGGGR
jgi:hypothetical protein